MNRHQRRASEAVKRREQRANLKRAMQDGWSAAAVIAEYQRRRSLGLADLNHDVFPADVRVNIVPPQAPDATE